MGRKRGQTRKELEKHSKFLAAAEALDPPKSLRTRENHLIRFGQSLNGTVNKSKMTVASVSLTRTRRAFS
jgi:hypothetical protein